MDAQMEIFWLGHAAFKVVMFSGIIIYLDPYRIKKGEEKADIIISSHGHGDHFSKSDIKKLMKDDTILLGPMSCAYQLEECNGRPLEIGESFDRKDFSIEFVPAYTIKKSTHPKSSGGIGTIIESAGKNVTRFKRGDRIYGFTGFLFDSVFPCFVICRGLEFSKLDQ